MYLINTLQFIHLFDGTGFHLFEHHQIPEREKEEEEKIQKIVTIALISRLTRSTMN